MRIYLTLLGLLFLNTITAEDFKGRAGFINNPGMERAWVDSVYQSLSLDEKIAQLIMMRSYSNRNQQYTDSIAGVLARYNIGGVIFFKGTPTSQVVMTNQYQEAAKTPLLIAMDAEWGLGMRLDSAIAFPQQLALGAIEDDFLIYEKGLEVGRQLLRLGVHINFAPVVDVNNNALNPVINSRSFGENNLFVASKSLAYMKGMQDMGIIAVAKHFPGHGDTDKDSHYTLPLIRKTFSEIDSIHLFPFRYLINNGLLGVMTAHLAIPSLDADPKAVSSLSYPITGNLLKNELGFEGLVITDGLEMKAIADYIHPDSVEIKALQAGNDLLILPVNTPRAIRNIRNAVEKNILPYSLIEERCRKVLAYKYRCGLADYTPAESKNVTKDINTPEAHLLNRRLIEASLTVPKNQNNLLPLMLPDTMRIASVEIGHANNNTFSERAGHYTPLSAFSIDKSASAARYEALLQQVAEYDLALVCIRNTSLFPQRDYGISRQSVTFLQRLAATTRVVLVLAGNPYSLNLIVPFDNIDAVMVTYHDNDLTVDLAAQALFGAIDVSGELPVTSSATLLAGTGEKLESLQRLKYTIPEETGISSSWLAKADSIALAGIENKAYPGCRVLVALDGKVIYDKSFGFHTYENLKPVKPDDVYDIASLTKIMSGVPAMMHLYQHGMIDIDQRLSYYLPGLRRTDKRNIVIRDLLTHQARLQPWIPFYKNAMNNGSLDPEIFSHTQSGDFTLEVAGNLFMNHHYLLNVYDTIAASPLLKKQRYLYSDLGFYWIKALIENLSEMPLEDFVQMQFYKPLGLSSTVYNAHRHIPLSRIVPTENDTVFRKQLLHGYVHDPGAAMFGGVGAHAGVFSTANDLAIIMQMFMNSGYYGGRQYFTPQIVSEFTRAHFPLNDNRRGLGFDKPQLKREINGPTSLMVSVRSFGHSGFTGTYAWADPEYDLLYIFLSNRVHPSASNNAIGRMNIRTSIHEVFYEALRKRDEASIYGL